MVVFIDSNKKQHKFDNIEDVQAWLKENGITDYEVVTPTYKPELPSTIEEFYDKLNYTPSIASFAPMSGQERRRERRAKERAKRK